jgi:predicted phage terminase large subunit-like protein
VIVVATRWHQEDLIGRLLSGPNASEWRPLSLPAIAIETETDALNRSTGEALWPQRWPVAELERRKAEMGSRGFEAQYQGNPLPASGNIFKASWLKQRYRDVPGQVKRTVLAIDSAWGKSVTGDFSAATLWGEAETGFFLIDGWHGRVEFPSLRDIVRNLFAKHNPHAVAVEDTASGTAIIQELRRSTHLPIIPVQAKGSKEARAEAITPLFESGRVWLPEDGPEWLTEWVRQHTAFPNGKHDDYVDTTSIALGRLGRRGGGKLSWASVSTELPTADFYRRRMTPRSGL